MKRISLALALVAAGCSRQADPVPVDLPARTATPGINEAIERLGAEDYRVRQEAADLLMSHGREALPYLEAAQESRDPEIQVRAEELTAAIEQEPLVWVGMSDDRWENRENWTPRGVPGPYSTAIVPQTADPLCAPRIRGQVRVRDLVLLRLSELTVEETAHLTVSGRLRSRGTLRALGVVEGAQ